MSENSNSNIGERKMDRLLTRAFPQASALSDKFEDQVMHEVERIDRARARQRRVARLMAVYWGIATAIMSGLLASSSLSSSTADTAVVSVALITMLSGCGLAWLIARQSGIGLQSLFARTLL